MSFYFQLEAIIASRETRYRKLYGEVPRFKAGLHFGKAVVAEMGHSKKEIALIGDVMNTSARLEQACKQVQEVFVISQMAMDKVILPAGIQVHKPYQGTLRGKSESIQFFGLERQPI